MKKKAKKDNSAKQEAKARKKEEQIKEMGVRFTPIAMEYMPACQECLYEIQLTNPGKIAEQMRTIGYRSSDLYPDTQRVAQDMENTDFTA